jgi:hypothetical protein
MGWAGLKNVLAGWEDLTEAATVAVSIAAYLQSGQRTIWPQLQVLSEPFSSCPADTVSWVVSTGAGPSPSTSQVLSGLLADMKDMVTSSFNK